MLRRRIAAVLILIGGGAAACSSDSKSSPPISLRAAADVESDQAGAAALEFGTAAKVEALTIIVTSAALIDLDGPLYKVELHIENTDTAAKGMPNSVDMICHDQTEGGGWQAASEISPGDLIPGGSFKDGSINLLMPGDSRTGVPIKPCVGPAFIRMTDFVGKDTLWSVPTSDVDAINAAAVAYTATLNS